MTVFKRGSVYKYHFVFNGEHIQRSTRQGNRRVAIDMEAAHRTRLAKGEVGIFERKTAPTLKEFAPRFIKFVKTNNGSKPETVRFYLGKLDRLLAYDPLARERLDRIDAAEIDDYIQHRSKQVSTVTVNRELATLRRLMHIAVEWKLIAAVPKIRMLKGERQRDFVLTPAGEVEYLSLAPQPLKDAAILMLDTGLRVGEVVRLTWADIQLEPVGSAAFGYLRVREGKSKNAKRTVPITARARLMLEERLRTCDCEQGTTVFGIERGTSFDHLHAKVRPLMKKQDASDFVLHSLRHTMLTRFGESGVDSFTIKKTAGHSSVTTSEKYIHPSGETMERAFQKMEKLNLSASSRLKPAAKSASPAKVTPEKLYQMWGIKPSISES